MEPYVEINYQNTKFKTQTCIQGGRTPVWKKSFDFHIDKSNHNQNKNVKITVYDDGGGFKTHDLLGERSIDLD